jgi:16S rRNA C967 or C1407 C5-methylase (RsmB/RsmF family)
MYVIFVTDSKGVNKSVGKFRHVKQFCNWTDISGTSSKDETDVTRCFTLQRQLLLEAIDCLKANSSTGGYLVYSTCSVLPEENEFGY